MNGNRKLKMVYAYLGVSLAVTVLSLGLCWAKPDLIPATLAACAGYCAGLSSGVGFGVWGNAQEHKSKGEAGATKT